MHVPTRGGHDLRYTSTFLPIITSSNSPLRLGQTLHCASPDRVSLQLLMDAPRLREKRDEQDQRSCLADDLLLPKYGRG